MQKLLICALIILHVTPAKAQLLLKNNKRDTLQIAVAMRYDTKEFKGWISKGWFKLNPGDSGVVGTLSGSSVCFYLQTTDDKVSHGKRQLLVHPTDPFTIKGADLKSTQQSQPNLTWKDFSEVKVPEKAIKEGRLMILL